MSTNRTSAQPIISVRAVNRPDDEPGVVVGRDGAQASEERLVAHFRRRRPRRAGRCRGRPGRRSGGVRWSREPARTRNALATRKTTAVVDDVRISAAMSGPMRTPDSLHDPGGTVRGGQLVGGPRQRREQRRLGRSGHDQGGRRDRRDHVDEADREVRRHRRRPSAASRRPGPGSRGPAPARVGTDRPATPPASRRAPRAPAGSAPRRRPRPVPSARRRTAGSSPRSRTRRCGRRGRRTGRDAGPGSRGRGGGPPTAPIACMGPRW